MTIRRLRLIALLGFLLLVAASVAVTFAALQRQRDDALVINMAGRQRMLIQKMTLEVLGIQVGANPAYYEDLHDTAHVYFEQTLDTLIAGGQVPYFDGTTITLPPTRDLKILAQLETVRANWELMHSAIHVVLDSAPGSSAFSEGTASMERLSPAMVAQMDEVVRLYEAEASRKVALAQAIQIGFLGAAVALLIIAFVLTERRVLLPIDQLGGAAQRIGGGDLDTPLSIAAPGEIDQLVRSFDDMRQNLAASRQELEQWAAELDKRVTARTREISVISAIAQAANRHIKIAPLLDEALPLLTGIIGADAAWVTLLADAPLQGNGSAVGEENAAFTLAGAHNLPPALEADDRAQMRWPGCACQRKLLAGELTAAANIIECQRLQQARGDTRGLCYHAAVPLRLKGRALGNLNLTTPLGRTFNEDELRLLTAVGDQIGAAVERAQLHEQVRAHHTQEQAALLKLSQALIGEADEQVIMDTSMRAAAETLEVELAAIALVEPNGMGISARAALGWTPEILPRLQRIPPESLPALAHVLKTCLPVVIPDEARETRFGAPPWVAQMGIAASLIAPMVVGGEAVGGLVVNSRTPREWDDDEVRLLTLIANETAQALARARAHAHAVERLERISALHNIDVAITSSLELYERLDTLLEKVTERLRVDAAAVALINPDTHELNYAARRGLDGEFFVDGLLSVNEGIAGQVAHSGEVAVIPDVSAEPRFVRRAIAARLGIVSYLAVPLRARGVIIGVLELATRERHKFLSEEIDFFVTLAGQAAIAIENARLFDETRRQAAQQGSLAETAGAILATLDVDALWPAVAAGVRETLAADRAAVYLYNHATDRVTCPHASGLSSEYISEINRRFHDVPGGRLLSDPRPVVIADAQTDPATAPIHELIIREGFHSYAVFPLIAPEGPLGALVAYRDLVAPFSPNDITTGQMLAHIVAMAMQNAELFRAEHAARKQAESLQQIGALLTTHLELNEVFERLFDLLAHVVAYDSVSVQLIDKNGKMVLTDGRGFPDMDQARRVVRDVQKIGTNKQRRWAEGRPMVIPDTHAESDWMIAPGVEYIRSWVGAPLLVKGELIGVLNVDSRSPGAYDQATGEAVMAFANQAAIAIKNARLFETEHSAREQSELLREAARAVSSTLDPDEVVRRILAQLKRALTYDTASVLLLGEAGKPALVVGMGYTDEQKTSYSAGDLLVDSKILRQMALDLQPVLIADVRQHPDWIWVSGAEHVRSFLSVPILSHDRMIGALMLDSLHPGSFKETDAHLLVSLAQHMAVAIENSHLFESTRRQLEELVVLNEVAGAAAETGSENALIERVTRIIGEALYLDDFGVLLVDEAAGVLRFHPSYRGKWSEEAAKGAVIPLGQGVTGRVAVNGQPWHVPDVTREPAYLDVGLSANMCSELCVPLKIGEKVIGVINAENAQPNAFSESDQRLLSTLASQLAIGIERARLFEDLANEQQHLELLYHLSMELAVSLNPEEVACRALRAATDAMGVNRGNILTIENGSENFQLLAVTGYDRETVNAINQRLNWTTSQGVSGRVVQTRTALFVPDVSRDADWVPISGLDDWVKSIVSVPLMTGDAVVGVLNLLSEELEFFKAESLPLITAIASPVALALQNARHYEGMHQRLKELEIIADTSSALRTARSYNDISPILLAKAVEGLKADTGALLLLENNALKFTTIHGETSVSTGETCPPDAGMMWQTLNSGKLLFIPDVSQIKELHKSALCQALMGDALSCACVPLQTTASAIGVVFLNWKKKSFLSAHESRLLESLAEIAANAIYRSSLHMQTVQQAQDLTLAYDATIEGWSRALDLRDRETEGHSQRVTNLTLQLAQAIGVSESELEHIRRGALLHDIGKMGVPDNILLKAGALSDEEWTSMRRHPQLAYEMLSPIAYLQPALDIPFCHHEKWDGSGYPRGLKGEEIPLTARIFAVVDVYDALTSDRPYRRAWTKRKTAAYIRQQAGIHFDPKVVDIFYKMVRMK